jgi:hypothetical protein
VLAAGHKSNGQVGRPFSSACSRPTGSGLQHRRGASRPQPEAQVRRLRCSVCRFGSDPLTALTDGTCQARASRGLATLPPAVGAHSGGGAEQVGLPADRRRPGRVRAGASSSWVRRRSTAIRCLVSEGYGGPAPRGLRREEFTVASQQQSRSRDADPPPHIPRQFLYSLESSATGRTRSSTSCRLCRVAPPPGEAQRSAAAGRSATSRVDLRRRRPIS